jgi:hypothetical protein
VIEAYGPRIVPKGGSVLSSLPAFQVSPNFHVALEAGRTAGEVIHARVSFCTFELIAARRKIIREDYFGMRRNAHAIKPIPLLNPCKLMGRA